jgi:hypothetical protein
MIDAPFLTHAEVRQEVERIFRRRHRSQLVALFGRGEGGAFDIGGEKWNVVPTRCELELRERLPAGKGANGPSSVYLVDWTPEGLPLDIGCRLAGARIYHVARDARLAALFGARQVEPGLAGSAVAKLLLAAGAQPPRKVQGLRLTHAMVWQSLLESRCRVPEGAQSSLGALLGWAARDDGGPSFLKKAETDDLWRNTRRELQDWLRQSLGDAAVVVWQCWERSLAGRLLEALPLMLAARLAEDPFLSGQLVGQLAAWFGDLASQVRRAEVALADDTLIAQALPRERMDLLGVLQGSQSLADQAGLTSLAAFSQRLPGGHAAGEQALGMAAKRLLELPVAAQAAEVVGALAKLERHELDRHLRDDDHRQARRNVARLSLWLTSRPAAVLHGSRWQPAVDLARRYAEEGGHLEWSRQQIRGLRGAHHDLLGAAQALDAAVSSALREDHKAFAEAYIAWLDAGKPSSLATPIEDVTKTVVAPFLKGNDKRKLLVVLMDGMSHATATQLLTRLGTARRWGPIAWRKDGWSGVLPLPPVLAVAPSLTELSRAAFFAGKADPQFGAESTDRDAARWRAQAGLAQFAGPGGLQLFVRKDILSGHDLDAEIRTAIRGDDRLVAVVVNAIDEDLKGSAQVAKDYSLSSILPLDALLSAAEEGERVVLLAADHGHVLGDGTRPVAGRLTGSRPGGPRWRALAQGEEPCPEEVVLPRSTWVPEGWQRVAALWDPTIVNRSAHYGEHGGVSLSEVVAPALLIAPDWLERAMPDDSSLAVRSLPVPDWWSLRIRQSSAPVELHEAERRPVQAGLFEAATPTVAMAEMASPLIQALRKSAVFHGQVTGQSAAEVDRVLSWLSTLSSAGGAMAAAEFAGAVGVRPHQVGGAVARMGILNADGFAMVEYDHVGRRVVLNKARLAQHYGVKE